MINKACGHNGGINNCRQVSPQKLINKKEPSEMALNSNRELHQNSTWKTTLKNTPMMKTGTDTNSDTSHTKLLH